MKKETIDYVIEKTHDLIEAPSCCKEAKAAAKAWLDAVGTDKQAEETKKFIAEIEEDIMPIDSVIAFTASETGEKIFGADRAKAMHAHGLEIKAKGARFCDCPACTAVAAILEKKDELLG